MRHAVAGNKLGRNSSWRKATIRDIAKATLKKQRICTTQAKAKEARKLVDRLITMGKKGTLAHRRQAFAVLCEHKLVSDLFNKIALRFHNRKGGYTRIIPLGKRRGDNAQLVFLELTEQEAMPEKKPRAKKTAAKTAKAEAEGKDKTAPAKKQDAPETKEPPVKQPKVETVDKKHKPTPEKKPRKKLMGGIQKMFRRKAVD